VNTYKLMVAIGCFLANHPVSWRSMCKSLDTHE